VGYFLRGNDLKSSTGEAGTLFLDFDFENAIETTNLWGIIYCKLVGLYIGTVD